MAWTTPLTAVASATLTAAQYNTHCRDNFLEMEPAKATGTVNTASSEAFCTFIASGANTIRERAWKSHIVQKTGTGQTTASTSYANLGTFGPSVSLTTGTQALVLYGCLMGNQTANAATYASVDVSGATTVAASDAWAIERDGHSAASADDNLTRRSSWKLFTGLNAGTNVFTMKYRTGSSTSLFNYRHLAVWAL